MHHSVFLPEEYDASLRGFHKVPSSNEHFLVSQLLDDTARFDTNSWDHAKITHDLIRDDFVET
jgi:hypothetical protein